MFHREAARRRESGLNFDKGELVVVVCAAIRLAIGPCKLVMDSLLSNSNVLRQFDLDGIHPHNVQVRLPSDLTGPSALYAIIIRHPRFRADSQAEWRDADLQHHGAKTFDEVNYIMESRLEKELHINIHEETAKAIPYNLQDPRGYNGIITKKSLEQNTDF
ncbi:MAG: hypothetical protein ACKPKO_54980, partial [Candidatus Fonsibacter sp.]